MVHQVRRAGVMGVARIRSVTELVRMIVRARLVG
jgi:hypothetical protein